MIKKALKTFFKSEISIGISLFVATVAALLIANSDNYTIYKDFFAISLPINFTSIGLHKELSLLDWINDGLMAIFFLLVGMELKREILVGELSSKQKVALPAIAALGGVIVPILLFVFFNAHAKENLSGFAVPVATDIAFAYGMISLFGKRVSNSLKIFLVALAVIDDLIAIIIIALFYSHNVELSYLILAALALVGLYGLNLVRCRRIYLYMILGFCLWLLVLKSGIHATLAGVVLALFIPLEVKNESPLTNFAHKIAPMVNFLILPLFAFANAGVKIENFSFDIFTKPLVLGIILGLFIGKQVGVMAFSFVAIKLKIAQLPRGTNWFQFYGAAIFTGVGFTMSLFIGSLAFVGNHALFDSVKIGVLAGSLLSAVWGIFVTYFATRKYHLNADTSTQDTK
jgi:NhaA family Na+:H+ antiporter